MKLTHHLDWNYSQPFLTKTLLLSFSIALLFHALFLLLFNIQDLLPLKDKLHPFVKVEAKIPKEMLEGVSIEVNSKYAKMLPPHPTRSPKASIPQVRRPSFFPKSGRLIAETTPEGTIEVAAPEKSVVLISSDAIEVKEGAALALEGSSLRSVNLLIDPRNGSFIALNSADFTLAKSLESELLIKKSNSSPFEEEITLQLYD